MQNYPGGQKLELSGCLIDYSTAVELSKRKRKSTIDYTVDKFYLLKPGGTVINPKVFVFVNDDGVGVGNSNASADFEKKTLDSQGYHSIKGWKEIISAPGLKTKMKTLVNTPGAEIVILRRGIETKSASVFTPLLIGFICLFILAVRGYFKTKKAEQQKRKNAGQDIKVS